MVVCLFLVPCVGSDCSMVAPVIAFLKVEHGTQQLPQQVGGIFCSRLLMLRGKEEEAKASTTAD